MSTQTQASQKKNPNRIRLRADDRAMAILCYGIVGLFSFFMSGSVLVCACIFV